MQLRPRKTLSSAPTFNRGSNGESETSDYSAESENDLSAEHGSDEEFHLSSSSDPPEDSSSSDDDMFEEMEVLGIKPNSTVNTDQQGPGNEQLPAQPPRAAHINFLGSTTRRRRNYHPHPAHNREREGRTGPPLQWEIWEEENEKWINENMTEYANLDYQHGNATETTDPPSELTMPLLPYQMEWLAWALQQEHSSTRGGILADEMGMGKTVQAIALVLVKREVHQKIHRLNDPSQLLDSSSSCTRVKATLVICPVVAVSQWLSEIDRFTKEGSIKVLVYHGADRVMISKQFLDYDFVVTTYSIVEADYRKYMMPPKKKCDYCEKSVYRNKLSIHLKNCYGAVKHSKQRRKKLKTVPLATGLDMETENHKSLQVEASEEEKRMLKLKSKSALHSITWDRIILDEAHYIKARHSNTAKAVFALDSSYKWALTGTPLQNRVGELYSLVRFLQMAPYSYYLCKDCDCKVLTHRAAEQCSNCPHNSVRHFCWWNKYISSPIQAYGNSDLGRRALILLKDKILKNSVLRRTKKGRAADLTLPPRIVSLRCDTLDIKEQDYYEALHNDSQAQFNTYVKAGTVMNNFGHIFQILTRLRQAVNHPYLVVYSKASESELSGSMVDADTADQVCGMCNDTAEDPVVASCTHAFCKACVLDSSTSIGQVSCPVCFNTVDLSADADSGHLPTKTTVRGFKPSSIISRLELQNFQTSTKMEALREEIRLMVERDGSAKGIVFSQFTSFLDLIQYSLFKSGINCVQLVGSMSLAARDAAVKKFNEDPDCKIFLMSLKAGGVALNLTVASHVFLMDPWWNPAVERQAQDRVHRIGQHKPIRIVKFVIENTIEQKILQLQEKKELVFEGTIGRSSEALGKLTEEDLQFLFVT